MANFLKHSSVPAAQKMIPVGEVSLPLITSSRFLCPLNSKMHQQQKQDKITDCKEFLQWSRLGPSACHKFLAALGSRNWSVAVYKIAETAEWKKEADRGRVYHHSATCRPGGQRRVRRFLLFRFLSKH